MKNASAKLTFRVLTEAHVFIYPLLSTLDFTFQVYFGLFYKKESVNIMIIDVRLTAKNGMLLIRLFNV